MKAALHQPQALFPTPWFKVAVAPIADRHTDLHPAEQRLVRHAVASRQASFSTGRWCARQALRQLDDASWAPRHPSGEAILPDAHGCPTWPGDVVGSISHSPAMAIAVATHRQHAQALGVDIESPLRGVPVQALTRVFDPQETAWLMRQAASDQHLLAYALFSAREALYKCVYQACAHRLAPDEVRIDMDLTQGLFHAQWLGAARALGLPRLTGRVGCDAGHVFSGVWCPPLNPMSSFSHPVLEPAHELAHHFAFGQRRKRPDALSRPHPRQHQPDLELACC